jgi:hypothetical protein
MNKPPQNYTTKIPAVKTIAEIQVMLSKRKVRAISTDYDDSGNPVALTFTASLDDNPISFRLTARYQGILKLLKATRDRRYQTEEQARNIAWRTLQDWVEAQLSLVDADMAELAEVFLPCAVNDSSGATVYELFQQSRVAGLLSEGRTY